MPETPNTKAPLIYLNSGNLSLCPPPVLAAIQKYRSQFEENPTIGLASAWKQLRSAQNTLAQFLNADSNHLFLRANITQILNNFILGAPLPQNTEILVSELEYGSIQNICRYRAEKSGLKLRILKLPQTTAALGQLDTERLLGHLISQLHANTSMLVLSHIIASTGMVMPLKQLSEETRKRGILLVVDGAYAPGAINIDFSQLTEVDFYGCSLYKWMMGPKGTAFGWVNPMQQKILEPCIIGWTAYESGGPFAEFAAGNRFQERFQLSGCQDFSPFRAIEDTIHYWKVQGRERIFYEMEERRRLLTEEVKTQLGWSHLRSQDPRLNGPILVFRVPEPLQKLENNLVDRLLQDFQVQIHMVHLNSGWHMVFTPHFYNTNEEIVEAISRIKKLSSLFISR